MTDSTFFHVAFLVRDLDEAIPRFERILGLSFLTPKPFVVERFVDVAHFGDGEPHPWTGRAVYSRQGPPYYELLEAKGHGVFSLDGREEGFHHVGMFVEDSDRTRVAMAKEAVEPSARILGANGQTRVWFSQPSALHGLQLELLDSTSTVLKDIMAEIASYQN
jgi:hypothetical protein